MSGGLHIAEMFPTIFCGKPVWSKVFCYRRFFLRFWLLFKRAGSGAPELLATDWHDLDGSFALVFDFRRVVGSSLC